MWGIEWDRRRARRTGLRNVSRQTEMPQDPFNDGRLADQGNQTQTPAAPGTGQHVEAESAPHEVGPHLATGPARWRGTLLLSPTRLLVACAGIACASGFVVTHQQEPSCGPRRQHAVVQDQVDPWARRRRNPITARR